MNMLRTIRRGNVLRSSNSVYKVLRSCLLLVTGGLVMEIRVIHSFILTLTGVPGF